MRRAPRSRSSVEKAPLNSSASSAASVTPADERGPRCGEVVVEAGRGESPNQSNDARLLLFVGRGVEVVEVVGMESGSA